MKNYFNKRLLSLFLVITIVFLELPTNVFAKNYMEKNNFINSQIYNSKECKTEEIKENEMEDKKDNIIINNNVKEEVSDVQIADNSDNKEEDNKSEDNDSLNNITNSDDINVNDNIDINETENNGLNDSNIDNEDINNSNINDSDIADDDVNDDKGDTDDDKINNSNIDDSNIGDDDVNDNKINDGEEDDDNLNSNNIADNDDNTNLDEQKQNKDDKNQINATKEDTINIIGETEIEIPSEGNIEKTYIASVYDKDNKEITNAIVTWSLESQDVSVSGLSIEPKTGVLTVISDANCGKYTIIAKSGNSIEEHNIYLTPANNSKAPILSVDDINNVIIGEDANNLNMEYNFSDNSWTNYNPNNPPIFPNDETVQVRFKNVGKMPASEITTLEFKNNYQHNFDSDKDKFDIVSDKRGYLSVKHYDISIEETLDQNARNKMFGAEVYDGFIYQRPIKSIFGNYNNIYSESQDGSLYFEVFSLISNEAFYNAICMWGYFVPEQTGNYKLYAYSDDGVFGTIEIGDTKKEFVDSWTYQEAEPRSNGDTYQLEEGKIYPIYIDYFDNKKTEAAFKLQMSFNNGDIQDVPGSYLYPSSASKGYVRNSIKDIDDLQDIIVPYGTKRESLKLPTEIVITLNNTCKKQVPVKWNQEINKYDSTNSGTYELRGQLVLPDSIINNDNKQAIQNVIVQDNNPFFYITGEDGIIKKLFYNELLDKIENISKDHKNVREIAYCGEGKFLGLKSTGNDDTNAKIGVINLKDDEWEELYSAPSDDIVIKPTGLAADSEGYFYYAIESKEKTNGISIIRQSIDNKEQEIIAKNIGIDDLSDIVVYDGSLYVLGYRYKSSFSKDTWIYKITAKDDCYEVKSDEIDNEYGVVYTGLAVSNEELYLSGHFKVQTTNFYQKMNNWGNLSELNIYNTFFGGDTLGAASSEQQMFTTTKKQVKSVTANPVTGSEVMAGTKIILNTETNDAKIKYYLGDEKYKEYKEYPDEGIEILKDTTINAYAYKENMKDSDISQFKYTIKQIYPQKLTTGTIEINNSNNKVELKSKYNNLVLVAQMQDYNVKQVANLRNNILDPNYGLKQLKENKFKTRPTEFKSFIEFAREHKKQKSNSGYLALETGLLKNMNNNIVGEAGTEIIDYNDDVNEKPNKEPEWHTIKLQNKYTNPIVIAQLSSVTGKDPSHIRIKDVTEKSFKVWIEEWSHCSDSNHHNHELMSYVVVEKGEHKLFNGSTLLAKKADISAEFTPVTYNLEFTNTPIVLSQTQKYDKKDQVWVRQNNINKKSAEFMTQYEKDIEGTQEVGIIAIGEEKVDTEKPKPPTIRTNPEIIGDKPINQDVKVTISGEEGATIEYKLTGDKDWKTYTTPVTITDSTTVTVRQTDKAENTSEEKTKKIFIDKVKPTVNITPKSMLTNKEVEVSISSEEGAEIYYSTNGNPPIAEEKNKYNEKLKVTTTTTVKAIAVDKAGNVSEVVEETYTIDTEKPEVPSISTNPEIIGDNPTNQDVKVTISGEKGASIYYTIDGNKPTAKEANKYDGEFTITKTTIVKAIAIDKAGNVSQEAKAIYRIDKEVPNAPSISKELVNGCVKITLTGENEEATIKYQLEENGEWKTYTKPITLTKDTTIKVKQTDKAGNESKELTEKIVVDKNTGGGSSSGGGNPSGGGSSSSGNPSTGSGEPTESDNPESSNQEEKEDLEEELIIDEMPTPLGAIEFYDPYIKGFSDGTFRPKKSVSRAEVAAMFSRILKLNVEDVGGPLYSDVISSNHWAYKYIQAVSKIGLFGGYSDGTFKPNRPIKRSEIAAVFSAYWDYVGVEVSDKKSIFTDIYGHWAESDINKLYNSGVVKGFADKTYRPNINTAREQIVIMINKIINRPKLESEVPRFSDVSQDHWSFGDVEASSVKSAKKNTEVENGGNE
ncbi:MAG: chitobiase/beta-hexosaminidase C-terminal domain-containing protein [Vallitalea sp.]|jgi:hypothetical protein|nr:chitobiase/beta-hexosaminidase C-terminal domain-containing protein [Vallitalea sp.]